MASSVFYEDLRMSFYRIAWFYWTHLFINLQFAIL